MAFHPSNITRRNFVSRAGLLVTALGLSGSVQSSLMEQITKRASKRWGREALAQSANRVKYMVEIGYRAGAQINALFPSMGAATTPVASWNPRLNAHTSPGNTLTLNRDGNNSYFGAFTAADEGGRKLHRILSTTPELATVGVAHTEALDLQTGQHTSNFATRAPTGAAVAPAVLHAAALAPSRPVQGIEWANGGGVTNQRGSYPALSAVNSRAQFQALFRELPMYFTKDELKLIVGAFDEQGKIIPGQEGTLQKIDQMWRSAQDPRSGVFNDTDAVVVSSTGGRNQSTLSLIAALDQTYTDIVTTRGLFGATVPAANGGVALGEALASAAAAFHRGASSTFMVALNLGDHHSDIIAQGDIGGPNAVSTKQGQMNINHGNALAGLWAAAALLDDPDGEGKVADHLLVKITSEFTRTPLRNGGGSGSDNGDGGTGGVVWMGKMVRNGNFGNINATTGAVVGFDRTTGALGGASPSEMQAYRTTVKMMGADGMAGTFGVGAAPAGSVDVFCVGAGFTD
jgi:hypothetical protein